MTMALLLLEAPPDGFEGPLIVGDTSGYPCVRDVETAGRAYEKHLARRHALVSPAAEKARLAKLKAREEAAAAAELEERRAERELVASITPIEDVDSEDPYYLLGLEKLRWRATTGQIRAAYKHRVLTYHPDKVAQRAAQSAESTPTAVPPEVEAETSDMPMLLDYSDSDDGSDDGDGDDGDGDPAETLFKHIQAAYERMCDPQKRRDFDSHDDFDEAIPRDNGVYREMPAALRAKRGGRAAAAATGGLKSFYDVFGPVFESNARFSTLHPIPSFGDASTPFKDVERFYAFWENFHSWRNFAKFDEENAHDAENREERRWIESLNKKERKRRNREERRRIVQLVDRAWKADPRVLQHKAEVKKARDELKKAAAARRREKHVERERAEARAAADAAAKAQAEAVAEAAKAQNAAKKNKLLRKKRTRYRAAVKKPNDVLQFKLDDIEYLSNKLDSPQLTEMMALAKACTPTDKPSKDDAPPPTEEEAAAAQAEAVDAMRAKFSEYLTVYREKDAGEGSSGGGGGGDGGDSGGGGGGGGGSSTGREWTMDELGMLSKGLAKFPGGTRDRWSQVARFIGTRSAKEVIARTKALAGQAQSGGKHGKGGVVVDDFTRFKETKKKEKDAADARQSAAAVRNAANERRTKLAADAEAAAAKQKAKAKAPVKAPVKAKLPPAMAAKAKAKAVKKVPPPSKATAKAPPAAAAAAAADAAEDVWTQEQQTQLEEALRTYPKSDKQRWANIATAVPGKSKKQCILRYKALVQSMKAKKAAAAAAAAATADSA